RPFLCPLPTLERSELRARGRLWNGTFLEEFLDVSSLELLVRAEVSVASPSKNLVLRDAATQLCRAMPWCHPTRAVPHTPWLFWGQPRPGVSPCPLTCPPRAPRAPQLGFFHRARRAPPAVPQYHAVRIPREHR
ncbi:ITA7 protein, partial [Scytalopus superciliaris]|nr:ITA7 protein [Scytalopus superciliaris]